MIQGELFPKEEPKEKVISKVTPEEIEELYKDDPENPERQDLK